MAIRANPLPILGLEHYVATARFRSQMLAREQLAPALLPVFASHEEPREFDYRARCVELKKRFRDLGLTRGGWRMLLRHGKALWNPLRRCHEFRRHPDRRLVDWADILALLPRHDGLPPQRIALVWAKTCSMRGPAPSCDAPMQARLLMAAWRRWDSLDTRHARRAWARNELIPVMAWAKSLGNHPPKVPTNAGFAWYLRQQRDAKIKAVTERLDKEYPGEPDREFHFDGLCFTRLDSYSSLYRAGLEFSNCLVHVADTRVAGIRPGSYYLVSDTAGGAPLVLLRADEDADGKPVEVWELRAAFNRCPPMQTARQVWQFVEQNQRTAANPTQPVQPTEPTQPNPFQMLEDMGIPCTDEVAEAILKAYDLLELYGSEPNERIERAVAQLRRISGPNPWED